MLIWRLLRDAIVQQDENNAQRSHGKRDRGTSVWPHHGVTGTVGLILLLLLLLASPTLLLLLLLPLLLLLCRATEHPAS